MTLLATDPLYDLTMNIRPILTTDRYEQLTVNFWPMLRSNV